MSETRRGPFNVSVGDVGSALMCPGCKRALNGAAGINRPPEPQFGDKGMCAHCGTLSQYMMGDDGKKHLVPVLDEEVTQEEREAIATIGQLFKQHVVGDPEVGMKEQPLLEMPIANAPFSLRQGEAEVTASHIADKHMSEAEAKAELDKQGAMQGARIDVQIKARGGKGEVGNAIGKFMNDFARAYTLAVQSIHNTSGDPSALRVLVSYGKYEIGEITCKVTDADVGDAIAHAGDDPRPLMVVTPAGEIVSIKKDEKGN